MKLGAGLFSLYMAVSVRKMTWDEGRAPVSYGDLFLSVVKSSTAESGPGYCGQ